MECHSKWNVTQNEMLLKCNVTQKWMSHKILWHSKGNITQNGRSPKMVCHLKGECLWKWNFTQT